MTVRGLAALAVAASWLVTPASTRAGDDARLNQIQVIGSHNSYHIAPHPSVVELAKRAGRSSLEGVDYTHPRLPEQFSRHGIRQIELDIFPDPEGGRFTNPAARRVLKALKRDTGPDPDAEGMLRQPGWKVLHMPDIDYLTTTPTFVGALEQVRDWSKGHPGHVPILVLVEVKNWSLPNPLAPVAAIGRAELDTIDLAIRSVFPREGMLLPDDVRGSSATLPEALRERGWPTLAACRGKVMFALDNEGAIRDAYLDGHPALQGRAMFATVARDHPAAAWMKVNDSIKDYDQIRSLVAAGFLVRTRTDADTKEARSNDPTRRDKAFSSGAQFVSTDFFVARPEFSPYVVEFPGHVVARPNPISGAGLATDRDLETRP